MSAVRVAAVAARSDASAAKVLEQVSASDRLDHCLELGKELVEHFADRRHRRKLAQMKVSQPKSKALTIHALDGKRYLRVSVYDCADLADLRWSGDLSCARERPVAFHMDDANEREIVNGRHGRLPL